MSFILDALKKSETERQEQSNSEFASVPSRSDNPNSLRWLWILGALLLVNVAVLLGLRHGWNVLSDHLQPEADCIKNTKTASVFVPGYRGNSNQ